MAKYTTGNKKLAKRIASERIRDLIDTAEAVKNKELQNRYVELILELKEKHKISIPRSIKERYCKRCKSYLHSNNRRIRIREGLKVITCMECKTIKRYRYR